MPMHDIDIPIVSVFNEVYYQCVRVRFDSNPGVDVGKRYFPEVEARFINNLNAAQLVFCLVWVLFQLKRKVTFNEECFIEQLESYIRNIPTSIFSEEADRLVEELNAIKAEVPDEFPTMTCPIRELCVINTIDYRGPIGIKFLFSSFPPLERKFELLADDEAWVAVTNNYSQSVIETLVELYSKPADKLVLLECIYRSCLNSSKETQNRVIPYIVELQDKISWTKTDDTYYRGGLQLDNDYKDNDLLLGMAREKFLQENPEYDGLEETIEKKAKRLEKESNELKSQYNDMLSRHKKELENIKNQYSSEIAELKERLSKFEKQTSETKKGKAILSDSQELSFTIAEVVEYAKEHFNEPMGKEVSTMLMRLALKHHNFEEDIFQLIDSIEKAIKAQNALQQKFDFSNVNQLNINPNNVENKFVEE